MLAHREAAMKEPNPGPYLMLVLVLLILANGFDLWLESAMKPDEPAVILSLPELMPPPQCNEYRPEHVRATCQKG